MTRARRLHPRLHSDLRAAVKSPAARETRLSSQPNLVNLHDFVSQLVHQLRGFPHSRNNFLSSFVLSTTGTSYQHHPSPAVLRRSEGIRIHFPISPSV